jgi:hypothetical protein
MSMMSPPSWFKPFTDPTLALLRRFCAGCKRKYVAKDDFSAKASLAVRSKVNFGVSIYEPVIWTLLCGGSGHRAMMPAL